MECAALRIACWLASCWKRIANNEGGDSPVQAAGLERPSGHGAWRHEACNKAGLTEGLILQEQFCLLRLGFFLAGEGSQHCERD